MIFQSLFITSLFFIPAISLAQVVITEIMYDPKGTDASAGGEWIEVQNTGSIATDLTQWLFFENDTNHGIMADGASSTQPGEYAVISRDLVAFKNYFNSFSGLLFKASFSLNEGENLATKSNKDDPVTSTNSITYTSEWGAKNDGNSLQKSQTGWIAASPTPGGANNGMPLSQINSATNEAVTSTELSHTNINIPTPVQTITVDAGISKQTAIVGADLVFKAVAHGLQGDVIPNARFMWSFGDGSTKEGSSVPYAYRYPGEYIVMLEGSSDGYSASDKIIVTVVSAQIFINEIGPPDDFFVSIKNDAKQEINIGGWTLRSGNMHFLIPANTFIVSGKTTRFGPQITKFSPSTDVVLLYPNGNSASMYKEPAILVTESTKIIPVPFQDTSKNKEHAAPVLNTDDKKSTQKEKNKFISTEELQAAVASPPNVKEGGLMKWIFALMGLIALSLGSLFFISRIHKTKDPQGVLTADEFTIIEEGEEKEKI